MRTTITLLTVAILAGCAGSPPKPPIPEGDYRPINVPRYQKQATTAPSAVFDFAYDGDITGALPALKLVAPELQVMPDQGKPWPVHVSVNLKATTLENALRTVGEQGKNLADVVWTTSKHGKDSGKVFIRFRSQEDQSKEENK